MTGGSLGLRTGSYGSLQQHLQNSVVLPIQTAPPIGRKPLKMLVSGTREKEKVLQWVCKIAARRRVMMLMMPFFVVVSVALFVVLMSTISKDSYEYVPAGSQSRSSPHFQTVVPANGIIISTYHEPPSVYGKQDNKRENNKSSLVEMISHANRSPRLPPEVRAAALSPRHPCENFAIPPPPADRKRFGPRPCPVCYVPVEQTMAFMPTVPSASPVLKNLTYVSEELPVHPPSFGGSPFGGYPSLKQRNDSFEIKESMNVHCGFVKGNKLGQQTGFDIDKADLLKMEQCHGVVVASAIFGNYDMIQHPKNISQAAKINTCFYMFIDEETEGYMKNSSTLDSTHRVGL